MAGQGSAHTPPQEPLVTQILDRLRSTVSTVVNGHQLDLDYFHYILNQEVFILTSASTIFEVPRDILETLLTLQRKVHAALEQEASPILITESAGGRGRPRYIVSEELLSRLIDMSLPISCIANILGVSQSTIFRRMRELGLSTKSTYSSLTDQELDNVIVAIKRRVPNAGYRMVKGCLQAEGHRVQWTRIKDSMHRVDAPGILERMTQLGCIVRRTYFVQQPLSLVHIDTNHKLIRYNIVIFGGIDGYSRKIMYLEPASNNCSSTALAFFLKSVQNHGWPSRVRGDEGVENVSIAETMFRVKGTGRGSFIAGKSVHNQSLEEDGLLDLSDSLHVFCTHYVFIPRLQRDLHTFSEGWDNHPLRSEGGLTPNQLWILGHMQNSTQDEEELQNLELFGTDWETFDSVDEAGGVHVPEIQCPLTAAAMEIVKSTIDPLAPSDSYGRDIYTSLLQYVKRMLTTQ